MNNRPCCARARLHQQRGFSLVEVAIVVLMLGVMTIIIAPYVNRALAYISQAATTQQAANNQTIADVLIDYARTQTTLGQLPTPYSGNGYTSTVLAPTNTTLATELTQAGLGSNQVNDDATGAHNVRVYQLASALTQQVPLYFRSGPLVTLTYQVGAVYSTTCSLNGSACNPGTGGIPGYSGALTSANATTWLPVPPDFGAQIFSTLSLQKSMLQTTASRADTTRDAFQNYFREQERMAAANDTTNWYPSPNGTGAPNLSGSNPAANNGCYDGWYNLSDSTVNVLTQVGLDQARYGTTQWGGTVQYCRDYNPLGTGANQIPHYGAIRFNVNVSAGIAPDSVNFSNNVVLIF